MSQANDMVPVKMINHDGASVVVKPKLGAKVKLDDAEILFYNGIDKVMAHIILQELMKNMIPDLSKANIYIICGRTDIRNEGGHPMLPPLPSKSPSRAKNFNIHKPKNF